MAMALLSGSNMGEISPSKLTAGEFSPLMYESKATARSEFAQFRQMFLLIGGILCAIIGLVGLLNFFNAMMTSILSHRQRQNKGRRYGGHCVKQSLVDQHGFELPVRLSYSLKQSNIYRSSLPVSFRP